MRLTLITKVSNIHCPCPKGVYNGSSWLLTIYIKVRFSKFIQVSQFLIFIHSYRKKVLKLLHVF
uniref:Uncharacterized protein n=1 Tax=Arundo donax TaxID=35708 RepID=A0A0A9AVW1_ARUDO